MTSRWTPAQRRLAALGLLVLGLGLGALIFVVPVIAQHRHYDAEIAQLGKSLERLNAVARTRTRSEQALKYLKRRGLTQRYYLSSQQETLASAELQQRAKDVIERNGGQLVSAQVLTGQRAGNATVAALRVNMRGDVKVMQQVLYELETGKPVLFVDQISIAGYGARTAQAQPAREPELTIRFDMSGYLLKRGTDELARTH